MSHLAHFLLILLSFLSPLHFLLCLRPVLECSRPLVQTFARINLSDMLGLFCVHIYTHALSPTLLHASIVCLVCWYVPFYPNVK